MNDPGSRVDPLSNADTVADLDIPFEVNEFGETITYRTSAGPSQTRPKADTPLELPASIGRYEIRGVLGTGSFGAVYQGYDKQLNRRLAIKVPLVETTQDQEHLFLQEARQLAQLRHPGIVTVHDVGVDGSNCYIVSEYLDGQNLNLWLKDHKTTWQEAAQIVAGLAEALAVAHAHGIIHRDVKPANIIMTDRGGETLPVLVDFGLALSQTMAAATTNQRGSITGTPNYMSPEQARGEGHRIDGRTDIYALGVVLYRMLTGQLPFVARSLSDLLTSVIADEPRPPRQFVRGLPRDLERICLKAMAKCITDRYTTAADLADELRTLIRHQQDPLERAAAPPKSKGRQAPREQTRILIADDHEVIRFKLQTDLEKWGHDVTAAEDGEQAWELFQRGRFSIVITDWMMPGRTGLELVHLIRAAEREDYVYIIMLTAKAEKHDIVAGMGAGADDFLAKPFHRDELQVRVRAGIRITDLNRALNESNRRLHRTHEAASEIYRLFLPTSRPQVPGIRFEWEHAVCEGLGGDLFNVVPLDVGHWGLFMLDVSGRGIPAVLTATMLSRLMSPPSDPASILVERGGDGAANGLRAPHAVALELNRRLGVQENKQFVTLLYGILDLESRAFRFASAGHPPLLHLRSGDSPRLLDLDGLPIGMAPDCEEFPERSVALESGDRLLIYSDGLPDTLNDDGEVFGAARLIEWIDGRRRESLAGQLGALMNELRDWRGDAPVNDDVSILALEVS